MARNTRLQTLINKCAKTCQASYYAEKALNDFCEQKYGTTPSDVDCDWIIDSLYGGCGPGAVLSEGEFDKSMREAIEMKS